MLMYLVCPKSEFGGNYDGEGFINKIVSEITAYKAIWVNAAGNMALYLEWFV